MHSKQAINQVKPQKIIATSLTHRGDNSNGQSGKTSVISGADNVGGDD